jgi:multisubunit Na+/H+ antiporter MnhB subunit
MKPTVRAASNADGLVSEMRQLVQTAATAPAIDQDPVQLERTVSRRIATFLMVLLVTIIFATSAVPDLGPSLAKVIQVHL